MKRVLSFPLLLITVSFILVSYVGVNKRKPYVNQTWFYNDGAANQRIEAGYTGQSPVEENTITASPFKNTGNWNNTGNLGTPYTSSDGSTYVNFIMFDLDNTTDGGGDGEVTLQEALNAIWNAYNSGGFPSKLVHTVTLGSAVIYLYTAENRL